MSVRQLHYTSCARGLSGSSGYQFSAVSAGVDTALMRQVESLSAYEPPRSVPSRPSPADLARCPVNLSFLPGPVAVLARVVYLGVDFTQRPGNYFAHAVATDDPRGDLGERPPIEFWDAPFWETETTPTQELPPLRPPLRGGRLDRGTVAEFVDGHAHGALLAPVVSAVARTMTGGERGALLVEVDSEAAARWIAAVTYVLPPPMAAAMSFATYQHRPDRGRLHLVGTLPEVFRDAPPDIAQRVVVFDLATGRVDADAIHPLAALVVRIGIVGCARLWPAAQQEATGHEASFDDWHPLAAVAALDAGMTVGAADIAAVAAWLGSAAPRLGRARAEALVTELLALDQCSEDDLAGLARACGAVGASALLQDIEVRLLEHDFDRLLFDPRAVPTRPLTTPAIRRHAADLCEQLLAANSSTVIGVLGWAGKLGLQLADERVRLAAYDYIAPNLAAIPAADIRQAVMSTVVRSAVLTRLEETAGQDPESVIALFKAGRLDFLGTELRGQRALDGLRIIQKRGNRNPVDTVDELARRRPDRSVYDRELALLWPDRVWGLADAANLAGRLAERRVHIAPDDATAWLVAALGKGEKSRRMVDYLTLVQAVRHPAVRDLLPAEWAVRSVAIAKLDDRTRVDGRPPAVSELVALAELIPGADLVERDILLTRLPRMILSLTSPNDVQSILVQLRSDALGAYLRHAQEVLPYSRGGPGPAGHVAGLVLADLRDLDRLIAMVVANWRTAELNVVVTHLGIILAHLQKKKSPHAPRVRRNFDQFRLAMAHAHPPRRGPVRLAGRGVRALWRVATGRAGTTKDGHRG